MKSYKAIIFDLDGVICSTDDFHYQAWKALADKHNIPFDRTINDRLRGVSRMESLEIILEKSPVVYQDDEKIRMAMDKNNVYVDLLSALTPAALFQGVLGTLAELRRRGYLIAIGSSSKNARIILYRIGLGGYFDAVADGTVITNSKPDPEVFLRAADYLKVDPRDCLIVEDAEAGVIAGKNAKMATAAVGYAKDSPNADYHLNDITDLLDICP